MKRRTILAGTGTLLAGGLAGCSAVPFGTTVSEEFSRTYEVTDETVVAVTNRNGPVTVRRTDGDELAVSGAKRARSREGLDSIRVEVVEGEQFLVDVRFSTGSAFSSRSVDLTVEVPDGVEVDRASTTNGGVTVEGVEGDLRATTSNGNVEVTDVRGYVQLESSNGNVRARGTTGIAGARTSNGDVDVELRRMRGDVTCRTSNGNVTVRVGPDLSTAVRLSTSRGDATVEDLPFVAATDRPGRVVGSLRGGDSPVLTLESTNGDVLLRPIQ